MGRHRLNYRTTLRRKRSPVTAIAAAVTICTVVLLLLGLIIAVLHSNLISVLANGRQPTPWMEVLILAGLIALCAWCGIRVVLDMYRGLRNPDEDVDFPDPEPDDGENASD